MFTFQRHSNNPILSPDPTHPWEAKAAFNGCILKDGDTFRLFYRALSDTTQVEGKDLQISSIGMAESSDGTSFNDHHQLIAPSESWDRFGCEDPRVTKIDGKYVITYTGLSDWPPYPTAIKVGVAIGDSLDRLEKHLVTPFNAKAFTLFPEKIGGKYCALLTVNTDIPPSTIGLAYFEHLEDLWSPEYWKEWYLHLQSHAVPLSQINSDQLEVGAPPVLTEQGWLFFYAHIRNYQTPQRRLFGVHAVILKTDDPAVVLSRTTDSILVPEAPYEKTGLVENIVFPAGSLLEQDKISLYYGAADTTCCVATAGLSALLASMSSKGVVVPKAARPIPEPLLSPNPDHEWEAKAVFNPAAYDDGKTIHLLYRAMSTENVSELGYAATEDGVNITARSEMPAYVPRAQFETAKTHGFNSGCEDPRLTLLDGSLYMCYTAFNGQDPPRVALSKISVDDFKEKNFSRWSDPVLISPPGMDDKDACIFPEKVNDRYVILHRIQGSIVIDRVESLDDFDGKTKWLRTLAVIPPGEEIWESEKIGACSAPYKTDAGWLLFYHGVSKYNLNYRVGAMLLDLNDPTKVIARTPWPILEPTLKFEHFGVIRDVVFPCGIIKREDDLFFYFGSADLSVGVATISFKAVMDYLKDSPVSSLGE